MWGRWSSTLGLRVNSTRAYACHLNFESKRKGVLNNFEFNDPRYYNLYFQYASVMTLAEANIFIKDISKMPR